MIRKHTAVRVVCALILLWTHFVSFFLEKKTMRLQRIVGLHGGYEKKGTQKKKSRPQKAPGATTTGLRTRKRDTQMQKKDTSPQKAAALTREKRGQKSQGQESDCVSFSLVCAANTAKAMTPCSVPGNIAWHGAAFFLFLLSHEANRPPRSSPHLSLLGGGGGTSEGHRLLPGRPAPFRLSFLQSPHSQSRQQKSVDHCHFALTTVKILSTLRVRGL